MGNRGGVRDDQHRDISRTAERPSGLPSAQESKGCGPVPTLTDHHWPMRRLVRLALYAYLAGMAWVTLGPPSTAEHVISRTNPTMTVVKPPPAVAAQQWARRQEH